MTAVTAPLMPRDRPWTVADLAELPDDGLRYELVDGVLLVSPSPVKGHQRAVLNLAVLLREACPPHLEVFVAPMDYQPTQTRSLQPDLLVVSREDPEAGRVTTPLALAVEVLSPSTRSVDQVLKRAIYEQSGVEHYWLVDPSVPAVEAWRLEAGAYVLAGVAEGEQALRLDVPFPVELVPERLLD